MLKYIYKCFCIHYLAYISLSNIVRVVKNAPPYSHNFNKRQKDRVSTFTWRQLQKLLYILRRMCFSTQYCNILPLKYPNLLKQTLKSSLNNSNIAAAVFRFNCVSENGKQNVVCLRYLELHSSYNVSIITLANPRHLVRA